MSNLKRKDKEPDKIEEKIEFWKQDKFLMLKKQKQIQNK